MRLLLYYKTRTGFARMTNLFATLLIYSIPSSVQVRKNTHAIITNNNFLRTKTETIFTPLYIHRFHNDSAV
jgi:hypothetical protein